MPLQSIIVVFLRITAFQWVASGFLGIIPLLANKSPWQIMVVYFIFPILAILVWSFAELIARIVTRGYEYIVPLGGLNRVDLYAFAFVYLGLSFLISGIGSVIVNLCGILGNTVTQSAAHNALYTQSVEQIAKQSIQVILGCICLFNANRFAKKLGSRE